MEGPPARFRLTPRIDRRRVVTTIAVLGFVSAALVGRCARAKAEPTEFTRWLEARVQECYEKKSCRIALPRGLHVLSRPIDLCPTVKLVGDGADSVGTAVKTEGFFTAFHLLPYAACRSLGFPWHGHVRIEGLQVVGRGSGTSTIPAYGIHAENVFRLRDVQTQGFTVGLHVDADVKRKTRKAGNANGWRVDDFRAQKAEHAGVWIHGGDTNVGLWMAGGASRNCLRASKWTPILKVECAGVVEASFLGTTLINVSTATNWEHKPNCRVAKVRCLARKFPGFRFASRNQRSVCLGCYTEIDQEVSLLSPQSIAVGGLSGWSGRGLRISGQRVNGLVVSNAQDPTNVTTLRLGNAQNVPGSALTITSNADMAPLGFGVAKEEGVYELRLARLDRAVSLKIVGRKSAPLRLGTMRLRSALLDVKK
ncbi:MAG: hypothetical protein IPK13_18015 [Deltaproteobacteria bacterium]|nr:hypothetical protein [Deltaproteobacteria bacterium]